MLDFITFLTDIIQTVFTFVLNTLSGIVQVVFLLPQAVSFLTSAIAYIPSEIALFVSIALVIPVVYLIIGR